MRAAPVRVTRNYDPVGELFNLDGKERTTLNGEPNLFEQKHKC
jgi:hypothetical protein